jgi:hypothetical protein
LAIEQSQGVLTRAGSLERKPVMACLRDHSAQGWTDQATEVSA